MSVAWMLVFVSFAAALIPVLILAGVAELICWIADRKK